MKRDILAEDQRRIILDALKADNDYSLNNGILQRILTEFGHGIGQFRTDVQIDWLEMKRLVTIEELNERIRIVKLTSLGLDVANGHERIDGVARPRPEDL